MGTGLAAALARDLGLAPQEVRPVSHEGVANETFAVGDDRVLRVARPGFEADLAVELDLLPWLVDLDLPTPRLLADGVHAGRPWMLQTRLPGVLLARAELAPPARDRAYRELGRALHRVHTAVAPSTVATLRTPEEHDPVETVERLTREAWIGPEEARWVTGWFERLRPWQPAVAEVVVLHGDASPTNVLVEPGTGTLTGLIDWGDAFASDAAIDLAKVPCPHLPAAVAGYAGNADHELERAARALWHHLAWALGALARTPRPQDPTWSAPPAARFLQLTRLLLDVPAGWRPLLPDGRP